MGLDMNIYRKARPNTTQALLDKLEGKDEVIEVAYWRKFWILQEAIGDIIGEPIENCKEYELDKGHIEIIIKWLRDNEGNKEIDEWHRNNIDDNILALTKIRDKTDFDKYIIYYEGWW